MDRFSAFDCSEMANNVNSFAIKHLCVNDIKPSTFTCIIRMHSFYKLSLERLLCQIVDSHSVIWPQKKTHFLVWPTIDSIYTIQQFRISFCCDAAMRCDVCNPYRCALNSYFIFIACPTLVLFLKRTKGQRKTKTLSWQTNKQINV